MANDTEKLPKSETAKPKEIGRQDSAARDKELTDEQLRNITGGGGAPPIVVDQHNPRNA